MNRLSEQTPERSEQSTREALRSEPRVTVRIASAHGEKYRVGGLNGHLFRLPTEVPVEVPESIAQLFASAERVRAAGEPCVRGFLGGGAQLHF